MNMILVEYDSCWIWICIWLTQNSMMFFSTVFLQFLLLQLIDSNPSGATWLARSSWTLYWSSWKTKFWFSLELGNSQKTQKERSVVWCRVSPQLHLTSRMESLNQNPESVSPSMRFQLFHSSNIATPFLLLHQRFFLFSSLLLGEAAAVSAWRLLPHLQASVWPSNLPSHVLLNRICIICISIIAKNWTWVLKKSRWVGLVAFCRVYHIISNWDSINTEKVTMLNIKRWKWCLQLAVNNMQRNQKQMWSSQHP